MLWFFLACLIALGCSVSALLDQYVLRKYMPKNGLVTCFMGQLFYCLPWLLITPFYPSVLALDSTLVCLCVLLGIFVTLSYIPYYLALEDDDTHIIMPLYQLVPVIVLLLDWLITGERISSGLALLCALIIAAAFGLVYDFRTGKVRARTFLFISFSAFVFALFYLGKRYLVQGEDWVAVATWITLGEFVSALIAFSIRRDWFSTMVEKVKETQGAVLVFCFSQEFIYILGMFLSVWGLSIAPSTGVFSTVADSLIPVFGFVLPVILSFFLPVEFEKHNDLGLFIWKSLCVVGIIIASVFLYIETA